MATLCVPAAVHTEAPMIPQQTLREEYLDRTVNPADLGFCCIFLGGSAVHRSSIEQVAQTGSDWDGLGIVDTREDLINLTGRFRKELLQLLKVDYIDGSDECWHDAVLNPEMNVISISGWTRDGSNRAMKIWSRQHLEMIMQDKSTRTIGVLAHKFPRNIQSNHPIYGSGLLISQAIRLTDDVSLRFEDDFMTIPLGTGETIRYSTSPALMCDLLIASRSVYESIPGLSNDLKARTLSKWLAKSEEKNIVNLLPQLYRWKTFPRYYKEYLIRAYSAMNLHSKWHESKEGPGKICIRSRRASNGRYGYQAVLFEPLRKEQYRPVKDPRAPVQNFLLSLISESQYTLKRRSVATPSTLSLKDSPTTAILFISSEGRSYQVLERQMDCLATELTALAFLFTLFPRERLQRLVAIDPDQHKAFYSHEGGSRLMDIRIQYAQRNDSLSEAQAQVKEPYCFERWLLSIHTCMAQDVMIVYQASWLGPNSPRRKLPSRRRIRSHPLYEDLEQRCWMDNATLTGLAAQNQISVNALIALPISINGRSYSSLQEQLDRATQLLDPSAPHFDSMPTVFGLGSGHGGNVLVDSPIGKGTMPGLKYINYGQAGFYSPLIDIASTLYVDCFFPVLFADFWTTGLSKDEAATNGMQLRWEIDENGISIDYEVEMSVLDRSLAIAKLEYIVRPVFAMFDAQKRDGQADADLREQILGCGMLCCALLTREFPQRPDLFFINLAMGMRLARDLRGVFDEVFSWKNWT